MSSQGGLFKRYASDLFDDSTSIPLEIEAGKIGHFAKTSFCSGDYFMVVDDPERWCGPAK